MWVQPTTLAPASGFSPWARFLRAIRAGISERGGKSNRVGGKGSLFNQPLVVVGRPRFTLLRDLDFPASKVGLLDVFDAEVAVALGVLLLFVSRGRLVVGAVRVRRG